MRLRWSRANLPRGIRASAGFFRRCRSCRGHQPRPIAHDPGGIIGMMPNVPLASLVHRRRWIAGGPVRAARRRLDHQPAAAGALDRPARRSVDDDRVRRSVCGAHRVRGNRDGHPAPLVRRSGPRLAKAASRSNSSSIGCRWGSRRSRRPLPVSLSAFSNRYLHREPGYNRYFVLLAMFVTGMLLVALAGNVEVLFVGWEFVGLSSALLVAFFHERPRAGVERPARALGLPHQRRRHAVGGGAAAPCRGDRQPLAPLRRRSRGFDGRSDRNERDHHCRAAHRGRRRQERAAAVFELAPARHGGTHAVERRLLRIALDSRRVLPAVAVGAAARTRARGPPPRGRTRRGDGDLRGDHDARAERREIVAGLCGAHTSGHHRGRNLDRLVHHRLRSSGRTRLLSPAAVPERSERAPRSARDGRRASATGRLRRAAISNR